MSTAEIAMGRSAGPVRNDRRRNPCYAFMAEVEIVEVESGITITAHTSDFSRGGCYVDTFNPLPEDTVVTLRLKKWQQTLETQAKVVYSSKGLGMGLMFSILDTPGRATIEKWLTQLCGAQAC